VFDQVPANVLESGLGMQTKNEQIGFRIPAGLKKELQDMARHEGRTLSQICEILVAGGLEAYKKEGSKYVQRLLTRQKKEPSG
jgi:hypothetical protein